MESKQQNRLVRLVSTEAKVISESDYTVEYVASDQTIDHHGEVIMADGWRFDHFSKNAPFTDSHNYTSIGKVLGKVIDFYVKKKKLYETVQWAVDQGNPLADMGWKLTRSGFLKAVSVGFYPQAYITRWSEDPDSWSDALALVGKKTDDDTIHVIYLEQQQVELSAVVLGANPNALVAAAASGIITESEMLSLRGGADEKPDEQSVSLPDDSGMGTKTRSRITRFLTLQRLRRCNSRTCYAK